MDIPRFSRRDFITALSLGTGYIMFSHPLAACSGAGVSTDPFQTVKLGHSGLVTTLLGIGTGVKAGNRQSFLTRQEKSESVALLRYAYEKGIRQFDLADSYGTHSFMAEALQHIPREKVMLTSKIWYREGGIPEPERPDADVVVDRFLRELKTDYIDLVQIHCMVDSDWTDTYQKQMDILSGLKAKGIIRAHGVSVHSTPAMQAALQSPWVDVLHARINPYGIAMDQPEPEEVVQLIHQLHDSGKGLIGMKLVGNGKLREDSEKIDNSLRFVLGLGSVDTVVIGFETPEEIDNYAKRMEKTLSQMRSA